MSGNSFQEILDHHEFRQGDILRPLSDSCGFDDLPPGTAGMIITADCDIANDKFGDFLSYLPIVPAEAYLDKFWAPDRVNRLISEACKAAIDIIYRMEKKRDPNIEQLRETDFLDWFKERGEGAIVDAFPFNAKEKAQMAAALTLIRTATAQNNNEYPGIRRLRDCLSLKNITPDQQLTEAKKGLSDLRKALSFFIVPELPDSPPYGHVITLRDVRSIKATDVFPSRRAIPFHRKDDFCMYRIGRFSDRVRFGIAQKFASLFYRIGFTTEFETDQKAIPDLVAEQLFNRT